MSNLKMLGIWMRLKRWLRSILFAIGMKKKINWLEEADEILDIVNDTLDVRQGTPTPDSDPPPQAPTQNPYSGLKPKSEPEPKRRRRLRDRRRGSK